MQELLRAQKRENRHVADHVGDSLRTGMGLREQHGLHQKLNRLVNGAKPLGLVAQLEVPRLVHDAPRRSKNEPWAHLIETQSRVR